MGLDHTNRTEALTLADYRRMEAEGRITRPLTASWGRRQPQTVIHPPEPAKRPRPNGRRPKDAQ